MSFNEFILDVDSIQVLSKLENRYGINVSIGQFEWIPFIIKIPLYTIAKAQVCYFKSLHQFTVLSFVHYQSKIIIKGILRDRN